MAKLELGWRFKALNVCGAMRRMRNVCSLQTAVGDVALVCVCVECILPVFDKVKDFS